MIISYTYYRRLNYFNSFELCLEDEFNNNKKNPLWRSEVDVIENHHSSGRFLLSEAMVKQNVPEQIEYKMDLVRYLFEQKT